MSHLGLGTMTWGRETDADEAAAQLVAFRDAGGTLVDTATSTPTGESEQILGQLLADVVPRDELVIATKAGHRASTAEAGASTRRAAPCCASSTRRCAGCGIDYVDLWQLHVADPPSRWRRRWRRWTRP